MSHNTYTRESEIPVKITVAVSLEIAGVNDETLATVINDAFKELFIKD